MKRSILFTVVFMVSTEIFSQTDIDGFRGHKWGTPYSEMADSLVPSKSKTPGMKGYDKIDENFNYEGITAHTMIICI